MHTTPSSDHPKDCCGIFGACRTLRAAEHTYFGLCALQHRGQESAGIATETHLHKEMGLVMQAFPREIRRTLTGNFAIGHTRYSTTGKSNMRNAQPIVATMKFGSVAIAHNGNLTNAPELRAELEAAGVLFQTDTDSEVILALIAKSGKTTIEEATIEALQRVEGAYSLLVLAPEKLVALRDPFGFRPLSLGTLEGAYLVASETCAFNTLEARFIRDLAPGEMLVVGRTGEPVSYRIFPETHGEAFCSFEYIYFARPDSTIANRNVYRVRVETGRQLARECPLAGDIVVPIPDSGNCVALGYSLESSVPYEMAYVRSHFTVPERTFMQPDEASRIEKARMKLTLNGALVEGKRVLLADDSIVRGVTSQNRIKELYRHGAREVHVLIGCPPQKHACVYGIDFPERKKLLAVRHEDNEAIRTFLGAHSVYYLSIEGMVAAIGRPANRLCLACWNGRYPVPYDRVRYEQAQQVTGK